MTFILVNLRGDLLPKTPAIIYSNKKIFPSTQIKKYSRVLKPKYITVWYHFILHILQTVFFIIYDIVVSIFLRITPPWLSWTLNLCGFQPCVSTSKQCWFWDFVNWTYLHSRCGAAKARLAWALFVLLLSTLLYCQPTDLIWAFWFHQFSNFAPPPP